MESLPLDPLRWFNLFWFRPDVLFSFTWDSPYFLYIIPIIPLFYLLKWLMHLRFREKVEIAFLKNESPRDWSAMLRFIPPGIQSIFLALSLVALARPQRVQTLVEQNSEGIDIILALDISESMSYADLKPNRLEAAKNVAAEFVKGRTVDRIGIVVFAGDAFSLCPLTNDAALLNEYLAEINFDLIPKPRTAIGNALAVCTNRMAESKAKSRIVVLLSDGENTAGSIDPATSASLAAEYGVKVYTIAVGKDGPIPAGTDLFGNTQYIESQLDESTLRQIAQLGQGQFFRATSNTTLKRIFSQIDKLERSEIKIRRYRQTQDYYTIYLNWALIFFVVWLATKISFLTIALED